MTLFIIVKWQKRTSVRRISLTSVTSFKWRDVWPNSTNDVISTNVYTPSFEQYLYLVFIQWCYLLIISSCLHPHLSCFFFIHPSIRLFQRIVFPCQGCSMTHQARVFNKIVKLITKRFSFYYFHTLSVFKWLSFVCFLN